LVSGLWRLRLIAAGLAGGQLRSPGPPGHLLLICTIRVCRRDSHIGALMQTGMRPGELTDCVMKPSSGCMQLPPTGPSAGGLAIMQRDA
jgi:hypothetical protein